MLNIILAAASLLAGCHTGFDPVNKVSGNAALRGYDAVAYFTDNQAVEGHSEFQHQWQGATWQFASAANRDRFVSNPEQYAPQYGGYCAWAVGHGYTANGDPKAWTIIDGRLYLNYNEGVKKKWEANQSEYIQKGNENWPQFLKHKPEHKG